MNRFFPLLEKINARLELPQPLKSRIILEISADLDALVEAYTARGLSEEEALELAEEKIDLSEASLAELVEIHTSPLQRWMARLSSQELSRWERFLFIASLIFILLFTGTRMLSTRFLMNANASVWPVLGLLVPVLCISMAGVYRLYVKRDHRMKHLRSGQSLLFILSGAIMFTGVYGLSLEFYLALRQIQLNVDSAGETLARWLLGGSATLTVSLLAALVTALIWFILMNKADRIEQAEAAHLLNG